MSEQLAWCAGLFDGEGSFGAYKKQNQNYKIIAALGNTELELVEDFQSIIKYGNICSIAKNGNNKDQYRWEASSYDSAEVAKLLLQYLRGKKETSC